MRYQAVLQAHPAEMSLAETTNSRVQVQVLKLCQPSISREFQRQIPMDPYGITNPYGSVIWQMPMDQSSGRSLWISHLAGPYGSVIWQVPTHQSSGSESELLVAQ